MPAPAIQGTYSALLARVKVAFAVARGFEEDEILELLDIERDVLDDPDARLPIAPALRFWEHLVRTLDDPGVPVQFAERLETGHLGVLVFAAMTAASVPDGLERAARFYALLADSAKLKIEHSPIGARVELVRFGERSLPLRIMNENTVACLLRVVRGVVRADVVPVRVAFRHRAPADTRAHARFFRAPIEFDASWDGLVLDASTLQRVPVMSDSGMRSFFEKHAEEILRRLEAGATFTDRARAAITQELTGGEPQAATVAKRLGTSERSLRRQLETEGTGFRQLVDGVRRELALDYLDRSKANITEVAYLLGFSEVSAFSRAFRRWHGRSPRAYRHARGT